MAMQVGHRPTHRRMARGLHQKPGPMNALLPELKVLIFNQLGIRTREIASCVNRDWTQLILQAENLRFQDDLQNFIHSILPFLQKRKDFDKYHEKIQDIFNGRHFLPTESVSSAKESAGVKAVCSRSYFEKSG